MKRLLTPVLLICCLSSCAQHTANEPATTKPKIGGNCEGCEAIFESPVALDKLDYIDTLPGCGEPGPNIEISGVIYRKDGKTPAPGVVLYVYHTDQSGLYSNKLNQPGWAKRHGSIRGWIRTNEKGEYRFYTQIPASYPNSNNPKHIHPTIKEPGLNEYWIDEFIFDDDPLFQPPKPGQKARGGSGVLHPEMKDGLYRAKRDIILGLNVPGYPG